LLTLIAGTNNTVANVINAENRLRVPRCLMYFAIDELLPIMPDISIDDDIKFSSMALHVNNKADRAPYNFLKILCKQKNGTL
jgi:hypothetical protein